MDLSVVIPVYNEQDNVKALHAEVAGVCEREGYNYEVLFVDDRSSDDTVKRIKELNPVTLIRLRRNFGQTAAMDAGIKAAQYSLIATMDGDGQNDPRDIPAMIELLQKEELDVVSGWRKNRKDSFSKRFVSRGANFLRKLFINDGIHDSGCSLKIYKKSCFETVTLYGEMHRYIPAILKIKGFQVGEQVVNHRARTAGVTKYNWKRTFKGFIDLLSVWFWNKFAARPLHLLGGLGMVLLFFSGLSGMMTIYNFILGQGMSETAWPLLTMFLALGGLQLFVSGLLADILVKNYFETTKDSSYSISEIYRSEERSVLQS